MPRSPPPSSAAAPSSCSRTRTISCGERGGVTCRARGGGARAQGRERGCALGSRAPGSASCGPAPPREGCPSPRRSPAGRSLAHCAVPCWLQRSPVGSTDYDYRLPISVQDEPPRVRSLALLGTRLAHIPRVGTIKRRLERCSPLGCPRRAAGPLASDNHRPSRDPTQCARSATLPRALSRRLRRGRAPAPRRRRSRPMAARSARATAAALASADEVRTSKGRKGALAELRCGVLAALAEPSLGFGRRPIGMARPPWMARPPGCDRHCHRSATPTPQYVLGCLARLPRASKPAPRFLREAGGAHRVTALGGLGSALQIFGVSCVSVWLRIRDRCQYRNPACSSTDD